MKIFQMINDALTREERERENEINFSLYHRQSSIKSYFMIEQINKFFNERDFPIDDLLIEFFLLDYNE